MQKAHEQAATERNSQIALCSWAYCKQKAGLSSLGTKNLRTPASDISNYFNNVIFFVAVNPSDCRW